MHVKIWRDKKLAGFFSRAALPSHASDEVACRFISGRASETARDDGRRCSVVADVKFGTTKGVAGRVCVREVEFNKAAIKKRRGCEHPRLPMRYTQMEAERMMAIRGANACAHGALLALKASLLSRRMSDFPGRGGLNYRTAA